MFVQRHGCAGACVPYEAALSAHAFARWVNVEWYEMLRS